MSQNGGMVFNIVLLGTKEIKAISEIPAQWYNFFGKCHRAFKFPLVERRRGLASATTTTTTATKGTTTTNGEYVINPF